MPQSLAALHIHLVFSPRDREPFLRDSIRPPLHAYMATVLHDLDCHTHLINSMPDHVHLLFNLSRTLPLSKSVEKLKTSSSKWLKTQPPNFYKFAWQSGYGAFAVSASNLQKVRDYIANQQTHHQKKSFQDELRLLLGHHQIAFDERHLWD